MCIHPCLHRLSFIIISYLSLSDFLKTKKHCLFRQCILNVVTCYFAGSTALRLRSSADLLTNLYFLLYIIFHYTFFLAICLLQIYLLATYKNFNLFFDKISISSFCTKHMYFYCIFCFYGSFYKQSNKAVPFPASRYALLLD